VSDPWESLPLRPVELSAPETAVLVVALLAQCLARGVNLGTFSARYLPQPPSDPDALMVCYPAKDAREADFVLALLDRVAASELDLRAALKAVGRPGLIEVEVGGATLLYWEHLHGKPAVLQ
jgi:hypothetical protein